MLHNDDYDYVIHDDLYQDDDQDAVEMEDNPSYGRNQVSAHNTTNPHPNSSYSSNLRPNSYTKIYYEDEYFVESNSGMGYLR